MTRKLLLSRLVAIFTYLTLFGILIPFIYPLLPNDENDAAAYIYTDINLSQIKVGEFKEEEISSGVYLYIYKPSANDLQRQRLLDNSVWEKVTNAFEEKYEVYLYIGHSSYLGCKLTRQPFTPTRTDWMGGYYDSCHHYSFDYAGRAISKPEHMWEKTRLNKTNNLTTPTFRVKIDGTLLIEKP